MGDYAPVQLYVYDCPPEQAAGVLHVIDEYGLCEGWGPGPAQNMTELVLGEAYTDSEARLDVPENIAFGLQELAPGATFAVWSDPKYEWLGDLYQYVPSLGLFSSECDAGGTAILTRDTILSIVEEVEKEGGNAAEVKSRILARSGAAWDNAIGAVPDIDPQNPRKLPDILCPHCETRIVKRMDETNSIERWVHTNPVDPKEPAACDLVVPQTTYAEPPAPAVS